MNNKGKAICLVRVSTEQQFLEQQQANLVDTAKREGYTNIEIIEEKESGFKDEEDRIGLNRLKESIEKDDVSVVYARHIDRIARKKKVLFSVLEYLIEHKVQLRIIDPSITMLNANGTINEAAEMIFTLYAQMAESEMRVKKLRFKEGKSRLKKQNLFSGHSVVYGYKVQDKQFVIDEEKAFYVRKMFELYNNGYSQRKVFAELKKLGFDGTVHTTQRGIHNEAYKGGISPKGLRYPAIVSEEVFECAQRNSNNRRASHTIFGSRKLLCRKLIVCPECGYHYQAEGSLYVCGNRIGKSRMDVPCHFKCSISIESFDRYLWSICKDFYISQAQQRRHANVYQNKSEKESLKRQINKITNDINSEAEKRSVLLDAYLNGDITKDKYDRTKERLSSTIDTKNNELSKLQAKLDMLNQKSNAELSAKDFNRLMRKEVDKMIEEDFDKACLYVHSIIEYITIEKESFEDKTIHIHFKDGQVISCKYYPKKKIWEQKFVTIPQDDIEDDGETEL